MTSRLGVDLTGAPAALAAVAERRGRAGLRAFAQIELPGDVAAAAGELARRRRAHRLPRRAAVIAWPGEPGLEALRRARYVIDRVIAPGDALARVARVHYGTRMLERTAAVLVVHASSGALAVVSERGVLYETALSWSAASAGARSELLRRYTFLAELAEHLRAAFSAVRASHGAAVTDILTCGSVQDLRSLTLPLAGEFDVEVETLDTPGGIEIDLPPEAGERARDALPALRLAMAAALSPPRSGREIAGASRGLARFAAAAAGILAALAVALGGWLWFEGGGAGRAGFGAGETARAGAVQPREREGAVDREPPAAAARVAAAPPAPPAASAHAAPRIDPPETRRALDEMPASTLEVSSILWSPDRRFAVVDGRIVGVGDVIGGATVLDIRTDAILLRERSGALRRAILR